MSIKVENVSFTYSKKTPNSYEALHNVSLEIKKNSITGIVGHTGSGKSTLVQMFNGLLKPETGTITVDDFDQFRLCTEATYGELMDSLSEYNESTYRFFSGIQVTPNPSTSEWIEDTTNPVLRRNLPIENLSGQDSIYTHPQTSPVHRSLPSGYQSFLHAEIRR